MLWVKGARLFPRDTLPWVLMGRCLWSHRLSMGSPIYNPGIPCQLLSTLANSLEMSVTVGGIRSVAIIAGPCWHQGWQWRQDHDLQQCGNSFNFWD